MTRFDLFVNLVANVAVISVSVDCRSFRFEAIFYLPVDEDIQIARMKRSEDDLLCLY